MDGADDSGSKIKKKFNELFDHMEIVEPPAANTHVNDVINQKWNASYPSA